jgi:hypothetical protein
VKPSGNGNVVRPTKREYDCARNAGGLTIFEARIKHPLLSRDGVEELYNYDPVTELWFLKGSAVHPIRWPIREARAT